MRHTEVIVHPKMQVKISWTTILVAVVTLAIIGLGFWRISNSAIWWDEGWTLETARTWVEHNHYGRFQDGKPSPPGLAAAFPTTASVALSFHLFGVGVWQGRLPGVLYTFGAIALMYYLARELYNSKIAFGTLFVILLMPASMEFHALLQGRRVLAEMPMLFFLLAGYAVLLESLRRSLIFLPLVILIWGVAIWTKAQPLPFWIASMAVPLVGCVVLRRWRLASVLAIALVGSYQLWLFLPGYIFQVFNIPTLTQKPLSGIYEVLAVVPILRYRLFAVQILFIFGIPMLLGLAAACWQVAKVTKRSSVDENVVVIRFALLTLICSWCAWYVLLALSFPRYLFPVMFLSSMFVAALLHDLTDRFCLQVTLHRAASVLVTRRFDRLSVQALLAVGVIMMSVPMTIKALYVDYTSVEWANDQQRVVEFLNTQVPQDALVETRQSAFLFLVDRPYHYPPDQTTIQMMRHSVRGQPFLPSIDPNPVEGDYLVLDTQSQDLALYASKVESGHYRLVKRSGQYEVYERTQ